MGAPPILVYFSWDWDVHWGYDLDFDPLAALGYAPNLASRCTAEKKNQGPMGMGQIIPPGDRRF